MRELLEELENAIEYAERAPLLAKAAAAERAVRVAADLLARIVSEVERLGRGGGV